MKKLIPRFIILVINLSIAVISCTSSEASVKTAIADTQQASSACIKPNEWSEYVYETSGNFPDFHDYDDGDYDYEWVVNDSPDGVYGLMYDIDMYGCIETASSMFVINWETGDRFKGADFILLLSDFIDSSGDTSHWAFSVLETCESGEIKDRKVIHNVEWVIYCENTSESLTMGLNAVLNR